MSRHDPRLARYLTALLTTSLLGCAGFLNPAADSSLTVRGTVVGIPPGTNCLVQLHKTNEKLVAQTSVPADFSRSIVVAPGQHRYYVQVSCPGLSGRFRSQAYETQARTVIDLGRIVLVER